jgi:hypothetical protein
MRRSLPHPSILLPKFAWLPPSPYSFQARTPQASSADQRAYVVTSSLACASTYLIFPLLPPRAGSTYSAEKETHCSLPTFFIPSSNTPVTFSFRYRRTGAPWLAFTRRGPVVVAPGGGVPSASGWPLEAEAPFGSSWYCRREGVWTRLGVDIGCGSVSTRREGNGVRDGDGGRREDKGEQTVISTMSTSSRCRFITGSMSWSNGKPCNTSCGA